MASTLKADMFVPEIATDVASAEFPNELALGFAGSPFVTVIPEDQLGDEGDTVKFPRYNALTDMGDLSEDVAMTPEKLNTAQDTATVVVGGKAVEITDWADLASRGDPSEEVGRQIAALAARWADKKIVTEAETSALSVDTNATFTWASFVDAIIGQWGDRAMSNVGGLVVHSKVMGDVMKLPEFIKSNELGSQGAIQTGFIGQIGTYPVYVSDRLTTIPAANGAGTPTEYVNLVLKRGAIGLKFQRQLLVEQDRDILKKSTVIAADVRAAFHLYFGVPSPVIKLQTQ